MINIPILLTVARIMIVPFLVHAIILHQFGYAIVLLAAAAVSDALDGALARRWKQETRLGASLDPVADKLLVVACYVAIMSIHSPYFIIPDWFIMLVVVRELAILTGAAYVSLKKRALPIAPTKLGKTTTALQLVFIGFLLFVSFIEQPFPCIFALLFILVTLCVALSLLDYIRIAYKKVLA